MGKPNRMHTPAFKAQVALAAIKGDRTISQVAAHSRVGIYVTSATHDAFGSWGRFQRVNSVASDDAGRDLAKTRRATGTALTARHATWRARPGC